MRTTIDLPNDLFRRVKSEAALRGETLKEFVQCAIENQISNKSAKDSFRVKLPLIKSKNPKSLSLTNAEIENLLA
ncbi:MAG TPA: hypothetical protein VGN23_06500 [Verrucomicrobiae bacterium]